MKGPGNAGSRLLVGVILADVTCFGTVMPLLASYAAEFGAGGTAIGALVAVYSATHFVLAPVWGRLSDRIGRRPVLLLGLLGTLLASLLFALADRFSLLVLSRVVAGGFGATLHIAQAYVADQTRPRDRTRVMGLVGAAFGVGFIAGPLIGGLSSGFGRAAPGLAATALAAGNLLVAARWLPEPARRPVGAPPSPIGPRPPALGRYGAPFAAAFASTMAFTVIYVVLPLHAEAALGYGRSRVSYLFALVGAMTALVQGGVVGRLAPRFGEGRLVTLGGALMAAGLAALPHGASQPSLLPVLLAALALLGIGYGFAGPAEAGYVSRAAGPDDQGRMLGILQSINAVSRILGPVAAGTVMAAGGAPLAFLVASGAAATAGVAGVAMRREPSEPRPISGT